MKSNAITSLKYGLAAYFKHSNQLCKAPTQIEEGLINLFLEELDFLKKLKKFHTFFEENECLLPVKDYCFDLLMIHFLSTDSKALGEDYLESEEWSRIEDKTLDDGSEFLNLFLYLKECEIEGITPELSDFLEEFLLVNEDDFQEEHQIYEDIITHQILIESTVSEIRRIYNQLSPTSELKEIFYPFMCFFYQPEFDEATFNEMIQMSPSPSGDGFILAALLSFYQGDTKFPKSFINFAQ